jgi:propane monooxygenase reductase component
VPRVLFEPLGEEIDCDEDETILDASLRQGYSLVHGCREGQCSACKCYLLDGEVALKPYSTFALSEAEQESGYTLLCRAMPDDDLTVELLHFDPDNYRSEFLIKTVEASVESTVGLTHDISRVVVELPAGTEFDFRPGHYVDVHVPGAEGRRSFSMANLPGDGRLELMIKRYPGGAISGLLESGEIAAGCAITVTGPYGAFCLRENARPILMVAGGSGMAPQLALLRQLVAQADRRPVRFFYGARTAADLFALEEIGRLGDALADFRFVPVLSDEAWDGETGFVHEAVGRFLDTGEIGSDVEAYLCGPPPMVEAAEELLRDGRGLPANQIHFDKFTTAVAA